MKELYPLVREYQKIFYRDSEEFLQQVGKYATIRDVLVQVYYSLIKEGKCEPIEAMDQEAKKDLWAEAKRISLIHERTYLIEVCKALQGFGQFLQL